MDTRVRGGAPLAEDRPASRAALRPLEFLNFFMADVQAGIGPFLGVFLLGRHWQSGWIGTVMTIGGVAGMLMTTPAGAAIDASSRKRSFVVVASLCSILASALLLVSQDFWLVSASQIVNAIGGAAVGPAVAGITLGIVGQSGFNRQIGRNQAFNHAGNMVAPGFPASSAGSSASRPCSILPRPSASSRSLPP